MTVENLFLTKFKSPNPLYKPLNRFLTGESEESRNTLGFYSFDMNRFLGGVSEKSRIILGFCLFNNNGLSVGSNTNIISNFIQQRNPEISKELDSIFKGFEGNENNFTQEYSYLEEATRPQEAKSLTKENSSLPEKGKNNLVFYFRNSNPHWQGTDAIQMGLMIEDAVILLLSEKIENFSKIVVVPRKSHIGDFPWWILPNLEKKLKKRFGDELKVDETKGRIFINGQEILCFSDDFATYRNSLKSNFVELSHGTPKKDTKGILGSIHFDDVVGRATEEQNSKKKSQTVAKNDTYRIHIPVDLFWSGSEQTEYYYRAMKNPSISRTREIILEAIIKIS